MALKVTQYEMPDKTFLDEAYVRIKSIVIESNDYERLEPVDGTNDLKVDWTTRTEAKANIYVYADEVCRHNNVSPVHWFSTAFEYDGESLNNIYQQAYIALRRKYETVEDC